MGITTVALAGLGNPQEIIELAGSLKNLFRGSGNRRREGAEDIVVVVERSAHTRARQQQKLESIMELIDDKPTTAETLLIYMVGDLLAERQADENELLRAAQDLHGKTVEEPKP